MLYNLACLKILAHYSLSLKLTTQKISFETYFDIAIVLLTDQVQIC